VVFRFAAGGLVLDQERSFRMVERISNPFGVTVERIANPFYEKRSIDLALALPVFPPPSRQ
jgi:hypothetical protein